MVGLGVERFDLHLSVWTVEIPVPSQGERPFMNPELEIKGALISRVAILRPIRNSLQIVFVMYIAYQRKCNIFIGRKRAR